VHALADNSVLLAAGDAGAAGECACALGTRMDGYAEADAERALPVAGTHCRRRQRVAQACWHGAPDLHPGAHAGLAVFTILVTPNPAQAIDRADKAQRLHERWLR
jgi:hypothetical protein